MAKYSMQQKKIILFFFFKTSTRIVTKRVRWPLIITKTQEDLSYSLHNPGVQSHEGEFVLMTNTNAFLTVTPSCDGKRH